jgi:hypothetical protein
MARTLADLARWLDGLASQDVDPGGADIGGAARDTHQISTDAGGR